MRLQSFIKVISISGLLLLAQCRQSKPKDIVLEEEPILAVSIPNAKGKLSEYGFFKGALANLEPNELVIPYEVNAQLFTDYAYKKRFISLPKGSSMQYHPTDVFEFQDSAILIKNFFYPADFRSPDENIRLLETRLLIRENSSWKALTYVWNDAQTDATLEVGGSTIPVSWKDANGIKIDINYVVPNVNQCKSCHQRGDNLFAIGPTARQLNNEHGKNQLTTWAKAGLLKGLTSDEIPRLPSYLDNTKSLDQRARAWLEVNCAHCHREDGPAKTSGLHLLASVTNKFEIGIGKAPVAAGKGSGGLMYDIVPGKPDESILMYRINSVDPGVMMPELGRTLLHKEGIEIIEAWIRELK